MQFLLAFRCNYMTVFYCFREITIYWSKYALSPFLPTTVSFGALARGVPHPLGTGYEGWSQKLESLGWLPVGENCITLRCQF